MLFDLSNGIEIWDQFSAAPEEILNHHKKLIQNISAGKAELVTLAEACRNVLSALERHLRK